MSSELDTWVDLPNVPVIGEPPEMSAEGNLWYDEVKQQLNIWIDADWRPIGHIGGLPAGGYYGKNGVAMISETEPQVLDLFDGDVWFNPLKDELSIYVDGVWTAIRMIR